MTVSGRELDWRDDKLCYRGREQARIVPDATYPGMWRVQLPGGTLSDMVNKVRARDAARGIVLGRLNGQETPLDAPQRRVLPSAASQAPPQAKKRPARGTPPPLGREAMP